MLFNKRFNQAVILFATVAFLSVGVFGFTYPANSMKLRSDGTMSGCLFTGGAKVCNMSFTNHLSQWQGMLTATSPKISLILFSYLLALAVMIFASARLRAILASESSVSSKFYIKQTSYIPIFNSLKEAFSQGIINPKIFEATF